MSKILKIGLTLFMTVALIEAVSYWRTESVPPEKRVWEITEALCGQNEGAVVGIGDKVTFEPFEIVRAKGLEMPNLTAISNDDGKVWATFDVYEGRQRHGHCVLFEIDRPVLAGPRGAVLGIAKRLRVYVRSMPEQNACGDTLITEEYKAQYEACWPLSIGVSGSCVYVEEKSASLGTHDGAWGGPW